ETMQFVCTHLTPELTRARHEWQLHPNNAIGVDKIVVAHDRPHDALGEFEALFGPDHATAQLGIPGQACGMLNNAKVAVQSQSQIAQNFGKDALAGAPRLGIVGLCIRVNELDAAAAMLDMGRVPHAESKRGVIVPASAAHGVFIEFTEAEAWR